MHTYDGDVLWKEGIRDSIFIVMNGNDKEAALPLIRALHGLNLNHYAMFHPDGTNENKAGIDHRTASAEAMKRTCLLIWLLSNDSINSSAIDNELKMASENGLGEFVGNDLSPVMLFSVAPGISIRNVENDLKKIINLDNNKICDPLGGEGSDEFKKTIASIQERYVKLRSAGLKKLLDEKTNARKFSAILSKSMSPMNDIKRIEDDIKDCAEGETDDLVEMHVLTNELVSYDGNPYSCVAIANNLLGPCAEDGHYYPSKKNYGAKYFYYMTKRCKNEQFSDFKDKIEHYLKKDRFSRQEILYEIRKSYYNNLRLSDWIGAISTTDAHTFILQLGLNKKDSDAIQAAVDILTDAGCVENGRFSFPAGFLNWVKGEKINPRMIDTAKTFIKAVGDVIDLIKEQRCEPTFDFIKLTHRYLDWTALFALAEWQLGKVEWPLSIGNKKLNCGDDLLDFLKKLPPFANNDLIYNWMSFSEEGDGVPFELPDELVQEALANLYCIEVDETKMDLAYSFAFLMTRHSPQCTWYTTGRYIDNSMRPFFSTADRDRETVMVTSYTTEHHQEYVDAFTYLIKINGKEEELERANSCFYDKYLKQN